MPTYHYVCDKCGHDFEVWQAMIEDALEICPKEKCARKRWGKGKLKRQVGTGAGLIFKGSGFYSTDYRSEGYREAAKKESDAVAKKPEKTSSTEKSSKTTKPKKSKE